MEALQAEMTRTGDPVTIDAVTESVRGESASVVVATGSESASRLVARAYLLRYRIDELREAESGA